MERTTLTKGVGGDEVGDEEKGDLEMQEFALEERFKYYLSISELLLTIC